MSERDIKELKEQVEALVRAMNNGGTIKMKPQSWWVNAMAMVLGILVSTVGYHITIRQDIIHLQNAVSGKMVDRWTATMEREAWQEFRLNNPNIAAPDVDAIRGRVPVAMIP